MLWKMLIDDENSGQEAQLTLFNTHRGFSCSACINLPSVKCTSLGIKHKAVDASIRLAKTSLCLDAIKEAGYLWKQLCTEIWVSKLRQETSESVPTETASREEQCFGEGGNGNHCLHNGVITPNSRGWLGGAAWTEASLTDLAALWLTINVIMWRRALMLSLVRSMASGWGVTSNIKHFTTLSSRQTDTKVLKGC